MIEQIDYETEMTDEYWEYLEMAKKDRENYRSILRNMDQDSLIKFYCACVEAAANFTEEPYIDYLPEGWSEDDTEDVGNYILEQGKDYYMKILNNPELIQADVGSYPGFVGDIVAEYEDRYDEPIPYPYEDWREWE